MSEHQKDQDNIEQTCLDFVKNKMNEKDFLGLSNNQYMELKKWLKDSKPNSNSSKFPDFVFSDGFIEHFKVTSSLENKKGAKQKKESSIFEKKSETNFLNSLNSNEEEILFSRSYGRQFEEHTHCNIIKSIKRNWLKHIESYDKNTFASNNRIFLIEYIDNNIQTAISKESEPAEVFNTYRISVDKYLLDWIYTYKEKVDYLIFVNLLSTSIEIIRIDHIPKIIKGIPDIRYAPIVGIESHKYLGTKTRNTNF